MIEPLSEKTALIFSPIEFLETDRLAISLSNKPDKDGYANFVVNIYGATISEEEFRSNYKNHYSNQWLPNEKTYLYYARPSYAAIHDFPLRIPERKKLSDAANYRGERYEFAATDITASIIYKLWKPEQLAFKDNDAKILYQYLLASSARMSENAKISANYKTVKEEMDKELEKVKLENPGLVNGELHKVKEELQNKYFDRLVPKSNKQDSKPLQFCAERPLAPYQQVVLYLNNNNEGFGSFMEQGTGKTPPSIANIDNLALEKWEKEGKILKVLICCPNNVRANWQNEFQNFSTVDGRVTILRGDEMNRIKCFFEAFMHIKEEKYTVLIAGYDIVQRFSALFDFPQFMDGDDKWDVVICDEAHYFKDPKTKRWEKGLIKVRDRAKRRYVLTGTPVCNSVNDLWSQLEFIRKGGSGFVNFKNFQDFYSVYDEFSRTVEYQNLPFIQERLAMMSFFISKKEALPDLPEKVYDIIEVEMTSKQALVYQKIETELQYKIEQELAASANSDGKNDAMTVNNILTQLLRLAQITSGFITYDEVCDFDGTVIKPKRIERFNEQPKIDATMELLAARKPEEKTLIWACFQSDIHALQDAVEQAGYKYVMFYGETSESQRTEAEYLFNHNDEYTVFIGNAAAGGTGLNLLGYPPQHPEESESNVTMEIFFSQNWSAVYRAQAEDRAHRRGTRTNVRIVDLQVPATIDQEIRKRVIDKRQSAYEIADLKEVLRGILNPNSIAGLLT